MNTGTFPIFSKHPLENNTVFDMFFPNLDL